MIWSEEELQKFGLPEDDDNLSCTVIKPKAAIIALLITIAIIAITAFLL